LIVDDEDDINLLFKMVLEDNGYKVDTFNDPLAALQNFTAGSYDLLLLDIKMPKMNGFELFQKIKMIDENVKICFLTVTKINYDEFRKKVDPTVTIAITTIITTTVIIHAKLLVNYLLNSTNSSIFKKNLNPKRMR
jgi:CheY-like chemotaxis protein